MEREQILIRKIVRHGSREAANELVNLYYDEIYRFFYRQLKSPEDAMDLTQDCFIAALQSLPRFDRKKAGFRTWLYRIAMNKVIDVRRRPQTIAVPLEEELLPRQEDFEQRITDQVLLAQIEERVSEMEPEVQRVFRLHVYAGSSFPEIADITGEAEAKVKAQYYRLVQKLRKEFTDHE